MKPVRELTNINFFTIVFFIFIVLRFIEASGRLLIMSLCISVFRPVKRSTGTCIPDQPRGWGGAATWCQFRRLEVYKFAIFQIWIDVWESGVGSTTAHGDHP